MKHLSVIGTFLLMGIAGNVVAGACFDNGYKKKLKGEDLSGTRVEAVAPGGEEWNEDHCSSGDLYKLGDGTTVDPYAYRGTWVPSGFKVTYNYTVGGNSTYTWTLWEDTTTNRICWEDESGSPIIATAPAPGGAGSCSSTP